MTGKKKIDSLSEAASGAEPRCARTHAGVRARGAGTAGRLRGRVERRLLPPLHSVAQPVAAPSVRPTGGAAVAGPERTPMSRRLSESRMPAGELDARACRPALQAQVADVIFAYREASQRGRAPSSQRLMEFQADGAPAPPATTESQSSFFKERAVQRGASFDPAWRR